ncbi:LEAF RUST 10 DISEASE-RESISTANCE LOCUS RECEPTOR-LIKE PROTEIN KINASE-like 1.2 [Silene latifolia]|uniref:LEAF RUST 10 DISEASE-RESISTANCE LOCUS RECEPTOR-LIKE PROTEIN KINASE-like 1.2 n=1 Tax=Silene latifolia TaxID=37657 RepID=UPI003D76A651
MALHVYNLQYLTIILFIMFCKIYLSTGNNAYYAICKNNPFSCGNITNVGYPFWGGNRPQFCGHRNIGLNCRQTGPTVGPFIYDMGNTNGAESLSTRVVSINTFSHTMSLVQKPFSNETDISCQNLIRNETIFTLSHPFKLTPTVVNISLFFGCDSSVSNYSGSLKVLTCNGVNSTSNSAYYVDKPEDVANISKLCSTRRVFPVLKSELDDLNKGNVNLTRVLNKGFEVEYKADFDACSVCQNSGGQCGSSDDNKTIFTCYCPDGTYTPVCHKQPVKKTLEYVGSGIGGGILMFIAFLAIWYRKCLKFGKARKVSLDHSESELGKDGLYFGVPLFSYKELEEATNSFDHTRELGGGAFGTVYYGNLKDGREVAVKRLYERSFKRVEQFMNEVQILTCLRHQNLVSLYGCTSCHSRELLLVYEYVSNGTVADHLYGHKANSGQLTWDTRLKIAVETASALSYLHASDIIHRDVKTNNILLDKNFNVKVADFGLSRLFPNDVTHVSTAPQGTPGYLDPEYHQCYQLTDKSDVYSFGVVLVELISSLRAVDMDRHNYEINLSNYAMNRIQKCAFADLIDPQLGFESDFKVRRMTTSVAELAFQCLQHYKDFRPSMDEVLEVLTRIQNFDYEALQIEEMEKKDLVQITNLLSPSPTEDYGVKLLSNHQLNRQSPTSVMNIGSSSTISENTSK